MVIEKLKMQISIRIGRMMASALLFPGHEIAAISVSEMTSVFVPVLNPLFIKKIASAVIVSMYAPNFSHMYIKNLSNKENIVYQQAEICTMLLFFLTYSLYNI